MHKTFYVKDKVCFSCENKNRSSFQLTDSLILNQNNLQEKNTNFTTSQTLFVDNNYYFKFTEQLFQQTIYIDSNFNVDGLTLSIQQSVTISQKHYSVNSALNLIQAKQNINICQNWCNSDNVQNDNIIKYTVNADILVNDVLYSTLNIKYYTFDIFDDFSFFVDKNILQQKKNVDLSTKTIIYDNGNNTVLSTSEIDKIYQKIQITNRKYFVNDSIDGFIFNNRIRLTNGEHSITIRKINTPQVYKFNVNVVSPYRRVNDTVYYLDQNDRQNAKLLSNYQIQQNIVDALDTTLTVK